MTETETPVTDPRRTNAWGIDLSYEDAFNKWHDTPQQTVSAIMRAMAADSGTAAPPQDDSFIIVRLG